MGLVFLMSISDAFEESRAWLEAAPTDPDNDDYWVKNKARRDEIVEDPNKYVGDNVSWVLIEARWSYSRDRATRHEIGVLIDHSMDLVEAANPNSKSCSHVICPRRDLPAPSW